MELNPSEAEYHSGLANILTFAGQAGEAVSFMRRAFVLDPLHPPTVSFMRRAFVLDPLHPPNYDMSLARALLLERRFDEALRYLRDYAWRAPDCSPCHLFSAVAYAHLDRTAEAWAAIEDLRKHSTIRAVSGLLGTSEYLAGLHRDLIREALANAGLPMD